MKKESLTFPGVCSVPSQRLRTVPEFFKLLIAMLDEHHWAIVDGETEVQRKVNRVSLSNWWQEGGTSNSTAGGMLALHAVHLVSISSTPDGPSGSEVTPEPRGRNKLWVWPPPKMKSKSPNFEAPFQNTSWNYVKMMSYRDQQRFQNN